MGAQLIARIGVGGGVRYVMRRTGGKSLLPAAKNVCDGC